MERKGRRKEKDYFQAGRRFFDLGKEREVRPPMKGTAHTISALNSWEIKGEGKAK